MVEQKFIDKYNQAFICNDEAVTYREKVFLVINTSNSLLTVYDENNDIYSFPENNILSVEEEPSKQFDITMYVCENGVFYKEKQFYKIYIAESAEIGDLKLYWCEINDLLLNKKIFNATQFVGFKNVFARVKK